MSFDIFGIGNRWNILILKFCFIEFQLLLSRVASYLQFVTTKCYIVSASTIVDIDIGCFYFLVLDFICFGLF